MVELSAPRRVAIYGGSFDPPHIGHVLCVAYVLSAAPVDHVLVVPVFRHPFAKTPAPYADRLAMCRLAFAWIPNVTVSTVEEELGGESLTLRTVEHLSELHPAWSLRLLVGSDVVADLPKWHRWDRIAELAPPLLVARAGVPTQGAPHLLPEVSSTEVRAAVAAGKLDEVRALLPWRVADHIAARGLYTR